MVSATIGLDRTALTTDVGHGKVEAKVIIRSAGGGSDGGCSTGLTPLTLILIVPALFLKKQAWACAPKAGNCNERRYSS